MVLVALDHRADSSLDDLRRIADAGLAGAIVGRALYEGRFDLPQALEVAGSRPHSV